MRVKTRREWSLAFYLFIIFHCIPFEVWGGPPSLTMNLGQMGRAATKVVRRPCCWGHEQEKGDILELESKLGRRRIGFSGSFLLERSFTKRRYDPFFSSFFSYHIVFSCVFFCLFNFHPWFGSVCPANISFFWAPFEVIMYMVLHGLI